MICTVHAQWCPVVHGGIAPFSCCQKWQRQRQVAVSYLIDRLSFGQSAAPRMPSIAGSTAMCSYAGTSCCQGQVPGVRGTEATFPIHVAQTHLSGESAQQGMTLYAFVLSTSAVACGDANSCKLGCKRLQLGTAVHIANRDCNSEYLCHDRQTAIWKHILY